MLLLSNSIKIENILSTLQSTLNLRINFERDFDCGLNDIFDKRPEVVFIQDIIAGVTGESVIRHIQLLLGAAAPSFVVLHDGNSEVKPIKGLYDYLIDLSREEPEVLAEIQDKLKLLLGPRWQKIYIAPKAEGSSDEAVLPLSEARQDVFSQSLHDFIPETNFTGPESPATISLVFDIDADISPRESFHIISSTDDQLAEIIFEEAREQERAEAVTAAEVDVETEETISLDLTSTTPVVGSNNAVEGPLCTAGTVAREQTPPDLPADISAENEPMEEALEKVQWAFEGEQRLKPSPWKWYRFVELLLVFCLVTGGWYLLKQQSQPSQTAAKEVSEAIVLSPSGIKSEMAALPTFIPLSGLDPLFTAKNPGWERYIGAEFEFRLFRVDGKLKALQVMAAKGRNVSDALLKSILVELTGDGEYRVKSSEQKYGFQVLHATADSRAELLIYKKRDVIQAVVVSL